jgi:hypothetical protein
MNAQVLHNVGVPQAFNNVDFCQQFACVSWMGGFFQHYQRICCCVDDTMIATSEPFLWVQFRCFHAQRRQVLLQGSVLVTPKLRK